MHKPIVCELALTREDVEVLMWIMHCWLQQYRQHEYSDIRTRAEAIQEALGELG